MIGFHGIIVWPNILTVYHHTDECLTQLVSFIQFGQRWVQYKVIDEFKLWYGTLDYKLDTIDPITLEIHVYD